jgi:hypothetical protein
MRLRLVKEPFDNPDYLFELRHDGFRAIDYLQNGECKLISRKPETPSLCEIGASFGGICCDDHATHTDAPSTVKFCERSSRPLVMGPW